MVYAKAFDNYTEIYTSENSYMTPHTLKSVTEVLGSNFYRVHRSFVINFNQISIIASDHIILKGNFNVPISRTYKDDILKKLPKIL